MPHNSRNASSARSLYGDMRAKVFSIWEGPQDITVERLDGGPFYGWQTLALDIRSLRTDSPEMESRSVYANFADSSQHVAVLRAVCWSDRVMRDRFRESGLSYRLQIPARFVSIPSDRVRAWLSILRGVTVTIDTEASDHDCDGTATSRRLRIDRDHLTSSFEVTWCSDDADYLALTGRWEQVWREMTQALSEQPVITQVDEDYRSVEWVPQYDDLLYAPIRFDASPSAPGIP